MWPGPYRGEPTPAILLKGDEIHHAFAFPIALENRLIAVLSVQSRIDDAFATEISTLTGAPLAFTAKDQVVACSHRAETQESYEMLLADYGDLLYADLKEGNKGKPRLLRLRNEKRVVAAGRIKLSTGSESITYVFNKSLEKALGFYYTLRSSLILIGLVAVVISAFVAHFMSRELVKPIRQLVTATQSIAKGDLTPTLELHSKNELGELATAFNKMSTDLQNTTVSRNYV